MLLNRLQRQFPFFPVDFEYVISGLIFVDRIEHPHITGVRARSQLILFG